jgi:hypothetical protein
MSSGDTYRWGPGETLDIVVAHPDREEVEGRIVCPNNSDENMVLLPGFAGALVREAWRDAGGSPGKLTYGFESPVTVTLRYRDQIA